MHRRSAPPDTANHACNSRQYRTAARLRAGGARHRGRGRHEAVRAHRRHLRRGLPNDPRLRRTCRRIGHGQVRPRRPQARRYPREPRHARVLRPPRRGQPWRPRDDHRQRRRAGAVELGRDGRADADPAAGAAHRRTPHRHDRASWLQPRARGRPASRRQRRAGGLPDGARADREHDRGARDGRRARSGTARGARLQRGRLRAVAPRWQPRAPLAADGERPGATATMRCQRWRRTRCCRRSSS